MQQALWRSALWAAVGMLAVMAALASQAVAPVQAAGVVRYVSPDGNCGPAVPAPVCFTTMQAAVDASDAAGGDEVRVAGGTFTGTQERSVTLSPSVPRYWQHIFIPVPLVLRGGYTVPSWDAPDATNPTVIDLGGAPGVGRGITIVNGGGTGPVVVENLTIRNGNYTGRGNAPAQSNFACFRTGSDCGGGLFATARDVELRHLVVENNIATTNTDFSDGGGIFLWNTGTIQVEASVIRNNRVASGVSSDSSGGGLFISGGGAVTVRNVLFEGNAAHTRGGGLSVNSATTVLVEGNVFRANEVGPGSGGGAWVRGTLDASDQPRTHLTRNRFESNVTGTVGAALTMEIHGRLTNSIFTGHENQVVRLFPQFLTPPESGIFQLDGLTFLNEPGATAVATTDPAQVTATNVVVVGGFYGFRGDSAGDPVQVTITRALVDGVGGGLTTTFGGPVTFTVTETLSGAAGLDPVTFRPLPGSLAAGSGGAPALPVDFYGLPRQNPTSRGAVDVTRASFAPQVFRGHAGGW